MAGLEMICAAIAAVGFVALPAKVAPAYRIHVAVVCFVIGGLFTFQLAISGALWCPAMVAAMAGVITLRMIIRPASSKHVSQGHA
jgi:hypothetical protein